MRWRGANASFSFMVNNTDSDAADAYFGFAFARRRSLASPMLQDSTGVSAIPIGPATLTGGPSSTKSTS